MKFAELKESLKKVIAPVYLITGEDLYLRAHAIKLIMQACVPAMPDLNMIKFTLDNTDFSAVTAACLAMPMLDPRRLVIVKDFEPKATQQNKEILNEYVKNPSPSGCLVLVSEPEGEFYKSLKGNITQIDCSKLDLSILKRVTLSFFKEGGVQTDEGALIKLIEFCNFNLARIEGEAYKLSGLVGAGGTVTAGIIEENVNKDIEFQIYELSNALAAKNAVRAYELIKAMLAQRESPQSILVLILNNVRRMFYACTQSLTENEIAKELNVKEYAVKMSRRAGEAYSKLALKDMLELGGELDFKIRRGEIAAETALDCFVLKVLNT